MIFAENYMRQMDMARCLQITIQHVLDKLSDDNVLAVQAKNIKVKAVSLIEHLK